MQMGIDPFHLKKGKDVVDENSGYRDSATALEQGKGFDKDIV
jgi:hypothetical protein